MSVTKTVNTRKAMIGSTHNICIHMKRITKQYKAITTGAVN